jgi:hypothetical protein
MVSALFSEMKEAWNIYRGEGLWVLYCQKLYISNAAWYGISFYGDHKVWVVLTEQQME